MAGALALSPFAGLAGPADAVSAAAQADRETGLVVRGILETKAIAEEGYVYGLPLVMNCAVQDEFFVDRDSGQFKAPFGQIHNKHRVFTYEDTAVVTPNRDTP